MERLKIEEPITRNARNLAHAVKLGARAVRLSIEGEGVPWWPSDEDSGLSLPWPGFSPWSRN